MRADMHKVIVERPRHGGDGDRPNRPSRVPLEDRPARESMRMVHTDRKTFADNLAPLRRWLRAQVGRPWNHVYREACSVIDPSSTVRNHLKVHLLEMVELHTFLRGREVWCTHSGWNGSEIPVSDLAGGRRSFYVHPQTGLLCESRPARRRPFRGEGQAAKLVETCRWIDSDTALLKLDGCWFRCGMRSFPGGEEARAYDRAFGKVLDRRLVQAKYGKPAYCIDKRQLSGDDLRRNGLKNSFPKESVPCIAGKHPRN